MTVARSITLVSSLVLCSCGLFGTHSPDKQRTQIAAANKVYVRNTFDTDPSIYLGRFVPRGRVDLDETAAMQLACSTHISYQFIEGGGVKYAETMAIGTEVAAKIGIPLVAGGEASAKTVNEVKVEYELTGKMVAKIDDPGAFAECCKAQPDQCTDRYIGEFLQGTGSVYQMKSAELDASGQGRGANGVEGSGSASHDQSHERAIEFPNPVYFAFKITETPHNRATTSCGNWVESPPTEAGYVFFVGASRPVKSEPRARELAERAAMMKAMQSVVSTSEMMADLEEAGDTDGDAPLPTMDPAAEKWAKSMQVVESCVEIQPSARGDRYVGRVLGKLPVFEAPSEPAEAADPVEAVPTPETE